jgi:sugar phosphate isomerase/epimerase
MMKLGIITSLWAYAESLSVLDSLQRISDLGLKHVDILGILHGDPLKLSSSQKLQIEARLQSLDIVIGAMIMLPPGNIASIDEEEISRCKNYLYAGINFISSIGGRQILINGGKRSFVLPHSKSWDNSVNFLRELSEYAQKREVFITVEAEPYVYFLVNDLDTTINMVKAVNHPNCMTVLDVGHMNLSRDAPQSLETIKPWVTRIHLSENDGLLHANDVLGTGNVDIASYLNTFKEMDFEATNRKHGIDFVAVMELGVLGTPIPNPDDYARRSMEHVLEIAPFLEI